MYRFVLDTAPQWPQQLWISFRDLVAVEVRDTRLQVRMVSKLWWWFQIGGANRGRVVAFETDRVHAPKSISQRLLVLSVGISF